MMNLQSHLAQHGELEDVEVFCAEVQTEKVMKMLG